MKVIFKNIIQKVKLTNPLLIVLILGFSSITNVYSQGLGVGVVAPTGQLDVLGVAGRPSGVFNDNSVDADFRIESDNDANMFYLDASTDRIGIGTALPSTKFHISSGAANTTAIQTIENTAGDYQLFLTTANPNASITGSIGDFADDVSNGILYFKTSGVSTNTGWSALHGTTGINWNITGNANTVAGTNYLGTTDAIDLVFKTFGAEHMRISSGGNVGVGVTIPIAKFDVTSTVVADVSMSIKGIAAQTGDFFQIQNSAGSDLITVSANAGVLGGVVINEQGDNADVRIEGDTDVNLFYTDASAEYVGIGTNAPTRKLDVRGTIIGAEPVVAIAHFGDDVVNGDDDFFAIMVASVPSTNEVWVRTTTASTINDNALDATANWTAWTNFGQPTGALGSPYIMSISVSTNQNNSDSDDCHALISVRMSDGTVYVRTTTADNTAAADMDNTAFWDAWSNFGSPGM